MVRSNLGIASTLAFTIIFYSSVLISMKYLANMRKYQRGIVFLSQGNGQMSSYHNLNLGFSFSVNILLSIIWGRRKGEDKKLEVGERGSDGLHKGGELSRILSVGFGHSCKSGIGTR